MPLALKVEVDERSLSNAGNHIASEFDNIGGKAAADFVSNFGRGVSSALPNALSGVTKGVFDGVGAAAKEAFGGVSAGAVAAGLAVAGLGTAAVLVGKQLYEIGSAFDAVGDKIAARTNAMGADMDRLNASLSSVFTQTASSLSEVGDILGRVSQSLHLTGQPLEDLTKQIADLNRMTGESVNIREFGKVFAAFGTDASQASKVLDQLYVATAKTGAPLNELLTNLINAGPAARTLGLNLDDTAGLFVKFEEGGLNASRATQALNFAAKVFADSNIDLKTGLSDTITQIRDFIAAGNEAAAVDLAGKVFGTRGAQQFVDLIRQGKLGVDDLHGSLNTAGDDIEKLNDRTKDWAETWTLIKNRITDAAAQVGGPLFDALNKVAQAGLNPNNPGADQGMVGLNLGPDIWNSMFPTGGAPPAVGPGDQYGPAPSSPSGSREPGWGPSQLRTPQDINQAIEDSKKTGGAGGGGPVVPLGEMPQLRPGETAAEYGAEVNVAEAKADLAQKQATLNAVEGDNTKTADEIQKAKNDVIEAETRNTQAELRLTETRARAAGGPSGTAAVPLGPGFAAPPRPGETAAQYSAETAYAEAQNKTAQAQAQLQRIQGDSASTTDQLTKAHNDFLKAQRDEYEAQLRLSDAFKTSSTTLEEFGNKLDADLGLSEGLPGLAENLFKFLGNLAAAPLLGPLNAMSAAQGGIDKTGSGLIGMIASQMGVGGGGGSGGGSFAPGGGGGGGGGGDLASLLGPSGLQQGAGSGGGGANPNLAAMMALAQSSSGNVDYAPASDLVNGLADCSGSISDLYEVLTTGQSTAARQFTTTNFASPASAAKLGFLPGFMPGALNVGVNPYPGMSGHMAATLPNGVNFEGGGGTGGGAQYGGGAAGAQDSQFEQQYYYPMPGFAGGGHIGDAAGKTSWQNPDDAGGNFNPGIKIDTSMARDVSPGFSVGPHGAPGGPMGRGRYGTKPNDFSGGIPIMAHPGEHMLTAPDVKAMGGQGGVYDFRSMLHMEGGGDPLNPQPPPPPPAPPPPPPPGASGGPGSAQHTGSGAPPGPSQVGADKDKPTPPGAAQSGGGAFGAATGAAAMAADMFAPGSGAAVQIASQEIQRAVKAGTQATGAIVGGVMDTILPTGGSELANNNWITRIAGGFAGVQPQIPNMAGKSASVDAMNKQGQGGPAMGVLPPPISSGKGSGPAPGPQVTNNFNVTNTGAANDTDEEVLAGLVTGGYGNPATSR